MGSNKGISWWLYGNDSAPTAVVANLSLCGTTTIGGKKFEKYAMLSAHLGSGYPPCETDPCNLGNFNAGWIAEYEWQCPSVCTDGQTRACAYSGPAGTENVGICKAGTQICANGQWGACQGEVLPQQEICGDGIDNNCDGQVDEGCGKILQYYSGTGQEGFICETLQEPFKVKVTSSSGDAQSGIGIGWDITNQPTGAGASATPTSSTTDSGGLAASTLKLGSLSGDYTVNAICSQCTSGSPQTFTATAKCPDVPQYYQDDYTDSYDSICKDYKNTSSSSYPGVKACGPGDETWKIKAKGCMLTNMSMLLGKYGWSFKPNELNSAMTSDINGYTEDGDVQLRLPDVVTGQQIKYVEKSTYNGDIEEEEPVQKSLMDEYLKKCMPVIVQVINPHTNNTHWILVTGISGSDYTVNDPDSANKGLELLSNYGDIYKIRPYINQNGGCQ